MFVAFVDELQSGAPVVGGADLQADFDLSAAGLATAVFTVPMLVGTLVEPALLALTARLDRRGLIAAALATMGVAQAAAVYAPNAALLSAFVALSGIAAGIAVGLAEVALVAQADNPHRAMTRWALHGSLGDLAAPLLFAGCGLLGLPWRCAVLAGSAIALANALSVALGPPLREGEADEDEEGSAWDVARNPRVWAWLAAAAACTLFDEILVTFGGVWLREAGASPAVQGFAFAAFAVGLALGQARTDALVERWSAPTVLLLGCAACAVIWPVWLLAPPILTIPLGLVLGVAVSPMWALSTAEAYAASRHPGAVAALARLFGPVELAAPLLLGLIADRVGLGAPMLLLLLQPLVVGLAAWGTRRA